MLKDTALETNFPLRLLAERSVGLSGSDLRELCRNAAMLPVREYVRQTATNEEALVKGQLEVRIYSPSPVFFFWFHFVNCFFFSYRVSNFAHLGCLISTRGTVGLYYLNWPQLRAGHGLMKRMMIWIYLDCMLFLCQRLICESLHIPVQYVTSWTLIHANRTVCIIPYSYWSHMARKMHNANSTLGIPSGRVPTTKWRWNPLALFGGNRRHERK